MIWLAILLLSGVAAFIIYVATYIMNQRLGRAHNWIDVVAISALPFTVLCSPLFGEYSVEHDMDTYSKVVSFNSDGNVEDSSPIFVWCVTNNCTIAPWKMKVTLDESAIRDGKIVHFIIDGEVEVLDYDLFFTIPGVTKPTGWWDTPGSTKSTETLSKMVKKQLCRLVTYHTAELADAGFPLPRSLHATSVGDLVDKYVQPSLNQYGIKYTVTKFLIKDPCDCGQGEVPPRRRHGPGAY